LKNSPCKLNSGIYRVFLHVLELIKKTLAENFEQKKAAENSGLFFPKN
jgi:hypothetical protein